MEILARLTSAKCQIRLIDAQEKLKNISQIDFVHFSAKDVVRHPVVAEIIRAYEPIPNPVLKEKPDVEEE